MTKLKNSTWWKAAIIRAIKTIAQTAVGMITVGAAISEINWLHILSVSLVAGLVSLLTSIATDLPEVALLDTNKEEAPNPLDEILEEDNEVKEDAES